MSEARILLTGAAGFIGSHTWLSLLASGFRVVGIDDFSNSAPQVLDRLQTLSGSAPVFERMDVRDGAALDAFTEARVADPRLRALASRVGYAVDPESPYPRAYTGHVRARLRDGRVVEERQPHLRGGAAEPLTRDEIEAKFRANCRAGGWEEARAGDFLRFAAGAFAAGRLDLSRFRC